MDFTEGKCDGIIVDNPDGNSKGFSFGTIEGEKLGLIDNKMLGVANYSKVNILCLALIKSMKNVSHLSHVNEIFKESRGDLYLD